VSGAVRGAGFQAVTAFSLVPRAGGSPIPATRGRSSTPQGRIVTFDLSDVPAGKYDLRAENPGGLRATLEGAFEVLAAGSARASRSSWPSRPASASSASIA